MLTPFGKKIRKFRIDKGVRMADMADYLRMPASYLSAIEHGKKPIPGYMVDRVSAYFEDFAFSKKRWRKLADKSVTTLKIDLTDADEIERQICLEIAREIKGFSKQKKKALLKILEEA